MIKILNKRDCYLLILPDNTKIEFLKNNIIEAARLLETLLYAMGINSNGEKLQIVVRNAGPL